MLWQYSFTWYPQTTRQQVAKRIVQQHDAGKNYPERIRGWYNLAGGGSGFLLVETDDPRELTAFLQPYMDLMSCGGSRKPRPKACGSAPSRTPPVGRAVMARLLSTNLCEKGPPKRASRYS